MELISHSEAENLTGRVTKRSSNPTYPGSFADVWEGDFQVKGKTRRVAIKAPRLPQVLNVTSEKLAGRLLRELGSWAGIKHKNILPFLGFSTDLSPYLCLISPWMSNGTAIDYVRTRPDVDRVKMVFGVALGLKYLHSVNLVHGDLRGGNILISDNREPLIADFGLSRHIHDMSASTTTHGTPRWRAPELHNPEKYGMSVAQAHALPADVWSFGMTVLELVTGEYPYYDFNEAEVMMAIGRGRIPNRPTPTGETLNMLWPICLQCLVFWPNLRPSMQDIIGPLLVLTANHPSKAVLVQLFREDASNTASDTREQMDLSRKQWTERVQLAHQVAASLFFALFWHLSASWFRRKNTNVLFTPWLVGCLTWYGMQYVSFESSEQFFKSVWTFLKKSAWIYFVTVVWGVFLYRIGVFEASDLPFTSS
ncbi:kinase-like protein [Rickenella mellea]|uniref:Kinase-like protein n=1 Tax=Rickenella mellea TaxID=50990 RepID=A0A4Y7PY05_9AGAM|nr:kinase-like protein [Rickenella mellea]